MNEQKLPPLATPDQTASGRVRLGWGLWALLVLALAAVGALSYRLGALAPLANFTLTSAAMLIFGLLAGGVQGFAMRRWVPPAYWWLLASSVAGFMAACVGLLSTGLAATGVGLLAGWAYAWAVYGAVLGLMLQRLLPSRWLLLSSLLGWAAAGITSAIAGWALDVLAVTTTDPWLSPLPATARAWSMPGLAVMGAVGGALGGAITGGAFMLLARAKDLPQEKGAGQEKDRRLVTIAGVTCGLLATVLCTYLAPLVFTMLTEGSLDSLDMTIYVLSAVYATPVCMPAIAVVAIPLSIGCSYAGLEIARAGGRPGSRFWVWCGAVVGGVAGYLLGYLLVFAIGHQI